MADMAHVDSLKAQIKQHEGIAGLVARMQGQSRRLKKAKGYDKAFVLMAMDKAELKVERGVRGTVWRAWRLR